jgi:hypothetical protein
VPPNLYFQIDDIEEDWSFDYAFNFIFARMMTGSIGDWPRFFRQSIDNLEPGGWIEVQDISFPAQCDDDTLPQDSYLYQWSTYIYQASEVLGRSARAPLRHKQQLIAAGFVNVTEVVYKWPMNRWPATPHYKNLGTASPVPAGLYPYRPIVLTQRAGFWCYQNIAGSLSGLSLALFTRGLGWSPADVEVYMIKVREDMRNRSIHAWWPM